ncbi:MAG: 50S ribosomal protein L29 [Christensenellales bacterium]|jgi:large subunit ribosomal protein L29
MKSKFYELNNDELLNKLNEFKKELFNLRFKHATGQLSDGNQLNKCKKDIARVLTILRQRELGLSAEPRKAKSGKAK